MKKLFALTGLLLAGVLVQTALAQAPPANGGPQPQPANANAATTPIDGGASLLLASGVMYGLQRLRARRTAR